MHGIVHEDRVTVLQANGWDDDATIVTGRSWIFRWFQVGRLRSGCFHLTPDQKGSGSDAQQYFAVSYRAESTARYQNVSDVVVEIVEFGLTTAPPAEHAGS